MTQPRNTRQIEALDKLQRADHDLLVSLNTKFDGMSGDIRELKDGTALRLAHIETNIETNRERIDAVEQEIDRFKTAISMGKWIVGFQMATISFILANLSGAIDLFRR